MCTYSWFILLHIRNFHNIVKQLYANNNKNNLHNCTRKYKLCDIYTKEQCTEVKLNKQELHQND